MMEREERWAESSSSASSCSYCAVAWFASSLSVVRSASTWSDGGEDVLVSKSAIRAARSEVSRGGQNSAYQEHERLITLPVFLCFFLTLKASYNDAMVCVV